MWDVLSEYPDNALLDRKDWLVILKIIAASRVKKSRTKAF